MGYGRLMGSAGERPQRKHDAPASKGANPSTDGGKAVQTAKGGNWPDPGAAGAVLQLQALIGNHETSRILRAAQMQPAGGPRPAPISGAPVQRMKDPDGSLWKKFRDCAYAAKLTKYYVPEAKIQEIIAGVGDVQKGDGGVDDREDWIAKEKLAWDQWVAYCFSQSADAGVYKSKSAFRKMMEDKKAQIERLDREISLRIKDVPEKTASWEDEDLPQVPENIEPWMQTPTKDEEYEATLKAHYTKVQTLTDEAMDELHAEQGLMKPREETAGTRTPTDAGARLYDQLLVHGRSKTPMPLSKTEADFLLSTYRPEITGSIGLQWNPHQSPLKLNFQSSDEPISTNIIPGVGTYTEHLVKMQEQHEKSRVPADKPLHYGTLGGSREERIARIKAEILKEEGPGAVDDEGAAEMAKEIVLEEDKTRNLQLLEQSRSHRDLLATSLAFEGSGKLWPISRGLGRTMNPMYAGGATSAVNAERRTGTQNQIRRDSVRIAIETLHSAIRLSKDPRHLQAFKSRRWLYFSVKALRNLLKNVNDPALSREFKEVVKLYYRQKKEAAAELKTTTSASAAKPAAESEKPSSPPALEVNPPSPLPSASVEEKPPSSPPPPTTGEVNPPSPLPSASVEEKPPSSPPPPTTGEVNPPSPLPPASVEEKPPSLPPPPTVEVTPPSPLPSAAVEEKPPYSPLPPAGEVSPPSSPPPPTGEVSPPSSPPPPTVEVTPPSPLPPPTVEEKSTGSL